MYPSQHTAAALGAAAALAHRGWRPSALALFAAGAVLLDADHYASYVWWTGRWSLREAYRYHRTRAQRTRWGLRLALPALAVSRRRPLHTAAALAALVMAGRRWPLLRPLASGALFHRLLDFGWECLHAPLPAARQRVS
jgi:hypothetical protein